MTPEEKADLEILQTQMRDEKVKAFDSLIFYMRMKPADLANSGHKTIESAVMYALKYHKRNIDALQKAFLDKYPD